MVVHRSTGAHRSVSAYPLSNQDSNADAVGDMQLTRAEIARTQIIVTTPEKWDVVTRKPTGEGELSSVSNAIVLYP